MRNKKFLALSGIILAMFAIRVIPYVLKACGANLDLDILNSGLWNLAPLSAVCLLGGIYFGSRKLAISVAMAAWFLSSIAMSLLTRDWLYLTDPGIFLIFPCYIIATYFGSLLTNQSLATKLSKGLGLALIAECIFFLVTNTGCWLYFPYTAPAYQYPWTVSGLMTCYAVALPFFKLSLLSTAIFMPVLVLGWELAQKRLPEFQAAPQALEA